MKKIIVGFQFLLIFISFSLHGIQSKIDALKKAKQECLSKRVQCAGRVLNVLDKLINAPETKIYHFKEKPVVDIVFEGTVYNFNPQNVDTKILGTDMDGNYPIHYAAYAGDVGDLKTLIGWGADLNTKNRHDEMPLNMAARSGNHYAVAYLLQNKAKIEKGSRPFEKFNPFHDAIIWSIKSSENIQSALSILKSLSESDFKNSFINQASYLGTPLELAIKNQATPQVINFLLFNGAQITEEAKKYAEKLHAQYGDIKNKIISGAAQELAGKTYFGI